MYNRQVRASSSSIATRGRSLGSPSQYNRFSTSNRFNAGDGVAQALNFSGGANFYQSHRSNSSSAIGLGRRPPSGPGTLPGATTSPTHYTAGQLNALRPPPSPGNANSQPYTTRVESSVGNTTARPILLSCGTAGLQGFRVTMEDSHVSLIHASAAGNAPVSLFAILDGHCGRQVADIGAQFLPEAIFNNIGTCTNLAHKMIEAIVETDRHIFSVIRKSEGGSTLIAALIHKQQLYVACLGDSRAVLFDGTRTVAMSTDHKPMLPKEMERIHRRGGRVEFGRVCGCLAVSRALGDYEFKFVGNNFIPNQELMVSNVADITQINITDSTHFLILACDGLWDVLQNQEATNFVVEFLRKQPAAPPSDAGQGPNNTVRREGIASASAHLRNLLEECAHRLADYAIERGSMDNVSVTIIAFHTTLISDLQAEQAAVPPARTAGGFLQTAPPAPNYGYKRGMNPRPFYGSVGPFR